MKKHNLKDYTPIVTVEDYTIYEHPKTFHHVMVRSGSRGGNHVSDQVAQWTMPGLATDGAVTVPPGFMQAVIRKCGTKAKKAKPAPEGEPVAAMDGAIRDTRLERGWVQYGMGVARQEAQEEVARGLNNLRLDNIWQHEPAPPAPEPEVEF